MKFVKNERKVLGKRERNERISHPIPKDIHQPTIYARNNQNKKHFKKRKPSPHAQLSTAPHRHPRP